MSSITIKVEDAEAGTVSLHSFTRSPVRIGRSALNNLTLDKPFVSGYHAVARFDENGVTLADLGSRNGTAVDGVPLDKNVPAVVTKDSQVKIGSLRLTLAVFEDASPESVRAGGVQVQVSGVASAATGGGWPPAPPPGLSPFPPAAPSVAPSAPAPAYLPSAAAPYPPAPVTPYSPANSPSSAASYVPPNPPACPPSDRPPTVIVSDSLADISPASSAPGAPAAPAGTVPGVGQTRMIVDGEVARMVQEAAAASALEQKPAPSPSRLAPYPSAISVPAQAAVAEPVAVAPRRPAAVPAQPGGSISRESLARNPPEILVDTLETFARGFIELRKGYQEFGSEMGLRPVAGSTPLHRAREPREILQYLLDLQGDRRARLQELVNIFADFMIHELALMNGMKEGIRKLVSELDPELVENGRKSRALRLFEGGKAMERYAEHFRQVTEDGGHSVVFGTAFARAYAAAVGNRKDE